MAAGGSGAGTLGERERARPLAGGERDQEQEGAEHRATLADQGR